MLITICVTRRMRMPIKTFVSERRAANLFNALEAIARRQQQAEYGFAILSS